MLNALPSAKSARGFLRDFSDASVCILWYSIGDEMTDVQAQEAARRKVVNRLRRAQGQLAAVTAAVERGEGCRDVVTQLAAVSKAIDRAGYVIIANSMRECVAGEGETELTAEELEKLFLSLA